MLDKEKTKQNVNNVGVAVHGDPHFEELTKKQKGITLIALIITIIVMLILVGVSVTVALNGGLFTTAKEAAKGTETERNKEIALSGEEVEIDGIVYASMEDYLNNNPKLPDDWTVATDEERVAAWPTETVKNENVTAIKEQTTNKIIPLPKGYTVSEEEGEYTVSGGLVIKDREEIPNEFVWIPVPQISKMVMCQTHGASVTLTDNLQCPTCLANTKLAGKLYATSTGENFNENQTGQTYNANSGLREPAVLSGYDTQSYFTRYEGGTYSGDDMYQKEFDAMAKSVATYGGFYVGRYETGGFNEDKVVSKPDRGMNGDGDINNTNWYKMYRMQKEFAKDSEVVASTMMWGSQYDQVMLFVDGKLDGTGQKAFNVKTGSSNRHSGNRATGTGNVIADKVANIYDLEGNMYEWTLEAYDAYSRVCRGR